MNHLKGQYPFRGIPVTGERKNIGIEYRFGLQQPKFIEGFYFILHMQFLVNILQVFFYCFV